MGLNSVLYWIDVYISVDYGVHKLHNLGQKNKINRGDYGVGSS